ncbi:hypothetical protein ASPZODRAFT_147227 [Penicilliopsis zonata CBS 506.65]|uniref:F-box domain-containing protein n=1 Tax=Penicilliopsis zonata CBS 506.65 TaxID=1073090 RepID=A0A1L9S5Z6_9EURO|nr:hypothetical protein ASPZODRAFT_147227 [Penicilliopsis zonata CBS 506.65]OJJ42591.1 hypothetical protein ASPZODRAFT_147227 [Penicilliopsis zonata CBS 506.65]
MRDCCICCGLRVADQPSWLETFRVLYSTPEGACLSDIGRGNWRGLSYPAPVHDGQTIHTRDFFWEVQDSTKTVVLLHAGCWTLLCQHLADAEVPLCLDHLMEMCILAPPPDWDSLDPQIFDNPPDPSIVPTIQQLTQSDTDLPCLARPGHADCFSVLPREIIEMVLTRLLAVDVFHLRLASRTLGSIFWSQTFWKSRFAVDGERGFLHSATARKSAGQINWRLLYRCTSPSRLYGSSLWNCKRIWEVSRWFIVTLSMARRIPAAQASPDAFHWTNVQGDDRDGDPWNCVPLGTYFGLPVATYRIEIPPDLVSITVTVIREKDVTWVTALQLLSATHPAVCVGYIAQAPEIQHYTVALPSASSFQGFEVALSSGGIRALRVCSRSTGLSSWLGNPIDARVAPQLEPVYRACLTRRLVSTGDIDALQVTCNMYRVVGIGIGQRDSSHRVDFRQQALWHPCVPASSLSLNEDSFEAIPAALGPGYHPLYWVLFGGPDGHALRELTSLSFMLSSQIPFYYLHEPCPRVELLFGYEPVSSLGDLPQTRERRSRLADDLPDPKYVFRIDGPGGERIDAVYVAEMAEGNNRRYADVWGPRRYMVCHYMLLFPATANGHIQISTNRGRFCRLGRHPTRFRSRQEAEANDGLSFTKIQTTPGTTIVGFYAFKTAECSVLHLGVISS